jgi:hypothetical protein
LGSRAPLGVSRADIASTIRQLRDTKNIALDRPALDADLAVLDVTGNSVIQHVKRNRLNSSRNPRCRRLSTFSNICFLSSLVLMAHERDQDPERAPVFGCSSIRERHPLCLEIFSAFQNFPTIGRDEPGKFHPQPLTGPDVHGAGE